MPAEQEFAIDEVAVEDYEEERDERRRRGWLPWLVLLVALLVVAWIVFRYSDFGRAPDVPDKGVGTSRLARVPDVVGLSGTEAIGVLEAAGFRVEQEVSFDVVASPDTVVAQDPEAGARAASGSTVFIDVTAEFSLTPRGPDADGEQLRVPNVVGHDRLEAQALLEADGFVVSVSEVYSASVPVGVVAEQNPSGGAAGSLGETVGIIVSLGAGQKATFRVPDLEGLTKDAAVASVRSSGLEARVMYQPMASSVGRVYQQSPAPGAMVPADRYVFVLVGARP